MESPAFRIDQSVAPPPIRRRSVRWPFKRMAVGDSFFCDHATVVVLSATRHQRAKGWQFTARTVVENGVRGTRCWRTA